MENEDDRHEGGEGDDDADKWFKTLRGLSLIKYTFKFNNKQKKQSIFTLMHRV